MACSACSNKKKQIKQNNTYTVIDNESNKIYTYSDLKRNTKIETTKNIAKKLLEYTADGKKVFRKESDNVVVYQL